MTLDAAILVGQRVNRVVSMIYKLKTFPTLCFRPRSELELVTCLLSVVKNVRETSVKMTVTAGARSQQWKERTLRSRARDTCLRMWATLPDLSTALLSLLMLTSLCYCNLPSLTQDNTALRYNTHPCTFVHRPLGCYFLSCKLIVLIIKKQV